MGPLATQKRRSPGLPEVPTFQKAGIKGLVIEPWFGVFVPAGTPAAIVARLNYLLSYANFNGMQIRACRRSTEPAWVAQSGAPPAASAPGREYVMIPYDVGQGPIGAAEMELMEMSCRRPGEGGR
jgi:hypothetical protein